MKNYGFTLAEGGEMVNLVVPGGTSFPANEDEGEMFYRTDENRLYVYNGTEWEASLTTANLADAAEADALTDATKAITPFVFPDAFNSMLAGLDTNGRLTSYTGDLDAIDVNSIYDFDGSLTTNEPSELAASWGYLITLVHTNSTLYKMQMCHELSSATPTYSRAWIRTYVNGTWGQWRVQLEDNHLAGLNYDGSTALTVYDLNTLTSNAHYIINSNSNGPLGFGVSGALEVIAGSDSTSCIQRVTGISSPESGDLWIREYSSSAWGSWQTLGGGPAYYAESATAPGTSPIATGTDAVAIGDGATATQHHTIAFGQGADATALYAVALGPATVASNTGTIAIGYSADATTSYAACIGSQSNASGSSYALALGAYANAIGYTAIAIGHNSDATDNYAISIGENTNALASSSIAIGYNSDVLAGASNSVAIGVNANVNAGISNLALGSSSNNSGSSSVSLGTNSNIAASVSNGTALGPGAKVETGAHYATAIGYNARAMRSRQIAITGSHFAAYGDCNTGTAVLGKSTTDASIKKLSLRTNTLHEPFSTWMGQRVFFTISVLACDEATSDCAAWKISGIHEYRTATPTIIGKTVEYYQASAGASTWTCDVASDLVYPTIDTSITGEVGKTIRWAAKYETVEIDI